MINFINTGLDDQILKSLNAETPDEDLQKAMNRQGLVQKEVQVKGKNGQVFTRKQWVKAGEDQKTGNVQAANDDLSSIFKFTQRVGSKVKYKGTSYTCTDAYTTNYGDRTLQFKSKDGKQITVEVFKNSSTPSQNYKGKPVEVWEIKPTKDSIKPVDTIPKSNNSTFKVGQTVKCDQLKTKKTLTISSIKSNKAEVTDGTNSWDVPMSSLTAVQQTDKSSTQSKQHWTKANTSQEAKQQITNLVASGKSREDCMSEFKAAGVTWKESDNAGINWMRACMAMNKYLTSNKVNTSQSNDNSSQSDSKSSDKNDTSVVTEYKNVSIQKFDSYNERRYSKPWVAIVDSNGKLDFSKDVGFYSGKPGESGELIVSKPQEGQVYAFGQKDSRGNNGGYSYVKFADGKFTPIDKTDLLQHLSGSSSKSIQKFDGYNERRYGTPWVAKVNSQGKPDFTEKVGKYSGQPGEPGELYVFEPQENQIYMFGQKDYRGNSSMSSYVVFKDGEFKTIDKSEVSKYLNSTDKASSTPTPTHTPTHSNPLVVNDTKSGRPYQVWEDNGRIYGSQPGKQNSRFVNDIKDFSAAGFTSLDEVKDYIKQYF